MRTNWMRALTVLYPDLSDRVSLELSRLEVQALAYVRQIKEEVIMKYAKVSNFRITISTTEWTLLDDIARLGKDIKKIEKAGGNYYGGLTIGQAKDLLAKLVLATK